MQEKTTVVNNLKVRYLETQDASNTSLVILHGWGSSVDSWTNVASALEDSGMKVFIPDLPGFGKTGEPLHSWGCAQYIDFIKVLARELGIAKFDLAGHSFGGQLAISYAEKYPEDLNNLILMSAARIVRHKKLKVCMFLFITKIGNLIFEIPPFAFVRPVVQRIWYKITGEHDYYRASARMREIFKRVIGEEVGRQLDKIKLPTLILWGDKDDVTPFSDARILFKKIPGAKLYVFSGEGHDLNLKKPREVAQKIVEFLKN